MPEPSLLKQWGMLGLLTGLLVFSSVYYYVTNDLKSDQQMLAVSDATHSESIASDDSAKPEGDSEDFRFGDRSESMAVGSIGG